MPFRVIECLERMNILGGQNTESVKNSLISRQLQFFSFHFYLSYGIKTKILVTHLKTFHFSKGFLI